MVRGRCCYIIIMHFTVCRRGRGSKTQHVKKFWYDVRVVVVLRGVVF